MGAFDLNALEKVVALKDWLLSLKPENEEQAQQLQWLAALMPLAVKWMPTDPAEVDHYLRLAAWAIVRCRSDDAPALGLYELVDGVSGGRPSWRSVEIEVGSE